MNCECACDYGDEIRASVSTTKIVTARETHTCCECREEIMPGERYEYVSGLWDGEWVDYRTCLPCAAIRDDYCGDGYVFGGLWEALHECMGIDYDGRRNDDEEEEEGDAT